MLNNVIRVSFASVGAITGFTLVKTFFTVENVNLSISFKILIFLIAAFITGLLFFSTGNKVIEILLEFLDRLELMLQKMTLYELVLSSGGLIAGLIVANLITIPINKVDVIGVPLSIIANILFGCIGIGIALGKKNESIFEAVRDRKATEKKVFTSVKPVIAPTEAKDTLITLFNTIPNSPTKQL